MCYAKVQQTTQQQHKANAIDKRIHGTNIGMDIKHKAAKERRIVKKISKPRMLETAARTEQISCLKNRNTMLPKTVSNKILGEARIRQQS